MKRILLFVLAVLFLWVGYAQGAEDNIYYTKVNLWFEKPKVITGMYHKGSVIPAGTKVEITRASSTFILFTLVEDNFDCRLALRRDLFKPNIRKNEWLNKFFTKNVDEMTFSLFDEMEIESIKKGGIKEGMTKAAVLVAHGYPPYIATSSLESDEWVYWVARFERLVVSFKNDRVLSIKQKFKNEG